MLWYSIRICFIVIVFGGMPIWIYLFSYWNRSLAFLSSFFEEDVTKTVFDFIVVGAGSSGLVLSHQLSKNHKVLLIEAGGDPISLHNIPGIAYLLLNHPEVDWMYKSVPQRNAALAYLNQQIRYPRGKSLGGSSNLNYMFYLRGNTQDYDNWANITGDETWKYENVLPYFKRSLDYNGKFLQNSRQYGKSAYGNLHVETPSYSPLRDEFIQANNELNLNEIDVNADQKTGAGDIEVTMKDGARWSTYRAFLEGKIANRNLQIARYSLCTKIELDENNRAIGVYYEQYGRKKFVRASKEIIISAGAIDSPKLLMLSGIGPKRHLESVGIKVKVTNEHVGQHLKDHTVVVLMPITIEQPKSFMPLRDYTMDAVISYFTEGKGVFTNPSAAGAQSFVSSSRVKASGVDWPDLQFYMMAIGHTPTIVQDMVNFNGYNESIIQQIFEPHLGKDGFFILPTLVRPKGEGEIKLLSKNPTDAPLIDPKLLRNSHDMNVLVEGMKYAVKLVNTKAIQNLGAKYHQPKLPGCENHKWQSDNYWKCFISHCAFSLYHPTGTCGMTFVVDSKLRVKNVKALRVADASIMPEIVNANTNAPSIMIGEKAADFIREYWASQYQVCSRRERLYFKEKLKCFYSQMS